MDRRLTITALGVAALAAFALFEQRPVMLVSVLVIGVVAYPFRRARLRERIIAIIVAGLGGGIAAEIAMTIYRHTAGSGAVADSGELFMMAILLGVINAAAMIALLAITEIAMKYVERRRR